MKYTAIRSEGGLIPYDLLDQIANEQVPGQKPADFGLAKERRLSDEIQRVWSDAQDFWDVFRRRMTSPSERDPYGTTETRERWLYPLLNDPRTFGYDLKLQASAITLNGASFPISHLAGDSKEAPPVHIEGFNVDLDRRGPKLRTSPRAMVQEFLNRSEKHIWGIATNGLRFLLLRDSARTARPTYLEFDLQTILEGNHFHEFALFYRLCHRSRLPRPGEDPTKCLLEQYYQLSIEQGGRVRDKLRDGVEEALKVLGTGFLRHPANAELRQEIESRRLTPAEYHRQLLRLVYRLLFLMVAEERRLIVASGEDAERHQRVYDDFYSVGRLRERTEGIVEQSSFSDLWVGLKKTFSLFSDVHDTNPLGIPPLNGELFSYRAIPDLEETQLHNHDLLKAIRRLSLFREERALHRVNYSALDVEELGSVYESLLDFQPLVEKETEGPKFELHEGGERKTTGSYYTRPELVRELIESALVPVIEDRLAGAEKQTKGKPEAVVKAAKEKAILDIAVCDPACGSGHFLLEAARRLGRELARIRTGQDEPGPEDFHLAVRDAISHCIYGVDMNPLAVDLCKLALWLEGHWIGKPLSFLDHRIKCGNSLIGVLDPSVLEKAIPDEAFTPITGDDKKVAAAYKKRNKKERETLLRRFDFEAGAHLPAFANASAEVLDFAEEKPEDVRRKEELYRKAREQKDWLHDWTAANLWTASFFVPLTKLDDPVVPTHETFMDYLLHGKDRPQMTGNANALFFEGRFFHWRLEFPGVFAKGGFDVVLGNPPWEVLQPEEVKFFAAEGAPRIAQLSGAIRKAAIEKLPETNPVLAAKWQAYERNIDAGNKFIRGSSRFDKTTVGKLNTYSLFAELATLLTNKKGQAGIIVQSGIATDDSNKDFFAALSKNKSLTSLYDFENREGLFLGVDSRMKFCLLTVSGKACEAADFVFFCTKTDQLRDERRRFKLSSDDLALLNPNSHTCPVFRTRADTELTKKIYRRLPVLVNETTGENPWGVQFKQGLFNMTSDSDLFRTEPGPGLLPLYEAKMIHQFDHRFATYQNGEIRDCTYEEKADPDFTVRPRYWVPEGETRERLREQWSRGWVLWFRRIARTTDERTMISGFAPPFGFSDVTPLCFPKEPPTMICCLVACWNSVPFDYVARQKIGGTHMDFHYLKQLPATPPKDLKPQDVNYIASRVVELTFTAWDLQSLGEDLGCASQPYKWEPNRRKQLLAELDGYFAHLYGLTRDELRYVLDPKDVFGEDFPSETFRVLKEKEEREHGEYRKQRLVLAAYDELAKTDRFAGEKRESAIEAPKGRSMVPVS